MQENNTKVECPKCGYQNDINKQICDNCGTYLVNKNVTLLSEKQETKKEIKISKKKNIILFTLFIILYNLIPILCFTLSSILTNNFYNDSAVSAVLAIVSLFVLAFLTELFTCLTVKLICKNTEYLNKCLLVFEIVCMIFYVFIMFTGLQYYYFDLILVLLRLISWFIARKTVIKEKIKFNKKILFMFLAYVLLMILIPNIFSPTRINKMMFKTFGSTSFSTKETYIELIDEYNLDSKRNVTYFHKLTNNQLKNIKELTYFKAPISNDDIKKLSNLESISITNPSNTDLDFTYNKNLKEIHIFSKNVKTVKLNEKAREINIDSRLSELDISNLTSYKTLSVSTDKLIVKNKDQLMKLFNKDNEAYFKSVVFGNSTISINKYTMNVSYDSYSHYYDDYEYQISLPRKTKVSDITCINAKIIIKDKYENKEKASSDYITFGNIVEIYDKNNELLLTAKANTSIN